MILFYGRGPDGVATAAPGRSEGESRWERTRRARHHDQQGPIDHGNGFWKLYLDTDDCEGLYQRCMDAGMESISAPERLEHRPVTAAFVRDPDGYMVEILEHHGEAEAVSGPGRDG